MLVPVSAAMGRLEPAPGAHRIRSEWFDVRLRDSVLELRDRTSGRRFDPVLVFISEGDRGDEYNADILDDGIDGPVAVDVHGTSSTATWQELRYTLTYELPASLTRGRRRRRRERVVEPIDVCVRLWRGFPLVEVRVAVVNLAQDHRLRVLVPLPFDPESVVTENHFHVARRPLAPPPWNGRSAELPPTTVPQKTFAAAEGQGVGVAICNRGLPEGELVDWRGRKALALTLLRCVGWLSRPDLRSRRGGAGPTIATVESQCPGRHEFAFAILPYAGDWHEAGIQKLAHAWAFPPLGWATNGHDGSLGPRVPLVAVSGDAILSAACRSEVTGDPLVRVYAGPVGGEIGLDGPWFDDWHAERVDLLEQPVQTISPGAQGTTMTLRPWEIAIVRYSP